jgi:peptide/nickel transport system substrate-binding protein
MNHASGVLEARLATAWSASDDGLTWTVMLRDGVQFSDGKPFTSADVVFTFRALYDPKVQSPLAEAVLVGGKPLMVRAMDPRTVMITFPQRHGGGLEILDGVPMLPEHRLAAALDAGTFAAAWSTTTPPSEIAGLGPFVIRDYAPGSRLVFDRNPRFWEKDAEGKPLPYLDGVDIRFVPDQNAEALQLETGDVDLTTDFVSAESIASLSRSPRIRVVEVGADPNPDSLWFNLSAATTAAKQRPWLQQLEFRQAVSYAVDRQAIADTVFLGAAVPIFGPITPGHGVWLSPAAPKTPFDAGKARALLGSIGLRDRNGDGTVDDAAGKPIRFTVLTQAGHPGRERTMTFVRDQLARVGIGLELVLVDPTTIRTRYGKRDFDTIYFGFVSSPDPTTWIDFWPSSGPFHTWNPGQEKPATPWEARIDALMQTISATPDAAERRRLFAEVQTIFGENLPMLYFVSSTKHVAMSTRVQGAEPSVFPPPVLWNAAKLRVTSAAGR